MYSIYDLATPRAEVLHGDLSEDMFAARLKDVLDEKSDPVYQDAERFFDNTYPTAGLKTLLSEVLGRLTGEHPANSPIIRLETSFGGGKSHNLIALYHAVKGNCSIRHLMPFIGTQQRVPKPSEVDVAGVVGSDLDPAVGIFHAQDTITTYTLWGELAYQLGKRAGYALAEQSDQNKIAPGTGLFERIIGNRPTLLMIDEIARHLRVAVGMPTASGKSNLAEQTVAFLMSLMEFVSSQKQVVLVLTMASESDAFHKETDELQGSLAEAQKISARQERVLTPTGENEIAAIVTHRLFKQVDRTKAHSVIQRYGTYFHELETQGTHVHERALRADYLNEFAIAYPFHPELIRVLSLRVATIPNFQRTRGALRLLANAVRQLWKMKPAHTWMIHTHHLDLANSQILEDLTSRLDRSKFKEVCVADIVSPQLGIPAHAAEADAQLIASGKPPYARHAGTTIFLHSLTQGVASGVELPDLFLSILTPAETNGDDPALVKRALERLYDKAWFLEYDGYRYRFKTEPSLNKIVDQEMDAIGPSRAKQEIDERIRKIWQLGYLKTVYFPTLPADVDDDASKPKLTIMHYEAVSIEATTVAPPSLVRKIYEYAGASEGFRNYQNNLLFLVADLGQREQMISAARRYLAINRITGNADRMREFNEDYQKKLSEMGKSAHLEVRVAITKAYRYLFYPTSDAPKEHAYLQRETVPPQDQGDTQLDQTNVVVRVLHNLKKVLTSDDQPQSAHYVKAKAWDLNQLEMTTEDLRRAFARKISLPILLDINQLNRTIENGVKNQIWLYYDVRDEFAYDHESPPARWEIKEETRLYVPLEAERLKLRIKGKWQPTPAVSTGGSVASGSKTYEATIPIIDDEPPDEELIAILGASQPIRLRGNGVPAQAFRQVWDQCSEHAAIALRRIEISFNGIDKEYANNLRAIGLAIPQMGKGNFGIELRLSVGFDQTAHVKFDFKGDWERYKRLKVVSDAFAQEKENSIHVDFRLIIGFEPNLKVTDQQARDIQDVLTQMGMGPIQVEIEPVYGETQ